MAFVVDGSVVTQIGLVMDSFIQWPRGGRFGSYTEWFSDGQFHTVAFFICGRSVSNTERFGERQFHVVALWWAVRHGGYTEWFSDGQFHSVTFVVDASAVTQSGLVIDSFIQWHSWWTVQLLHRLV